MIDEQLLYSTSVLTVSDSASVSNEKQKFLSSNVKTHKRGKHTVSVIACNLSVHPLYHHQPTTELGCSCLKWITSSHQGPQTAGTASRL